MANIDTKTFLNPDAIGTGTITGDKIKDNAITSAKISNGAVTYTKLATDSVIAGKIKNGAVTTGKINNSAVTTEKINDLAVTTDKIADGAVTTEKIGGEAVTSDELADSAVINRKIHDNAITTAKIVDNAITTAKIHNLDVTNDKIANKTITGGKIKNQTIWSNKLTWQTLSDASSDVDSSGILYTPVGPVETAAMFDNNVLSLGRPDGLLIEYARDYSHEDGGATWYEYYFSNVDKNYSDIRKVYMMTNGNPDSYAYFAGGKNYVVNSDGTLDGGSTNSNRKRASDGDALRFTFDAKSLGVYAQVVQIYAFISTNGSNITVNGSKIGRLKVKLETSTVSNPNSFTTVADNITVTGWSGWNAIPFNGNRFGHPNYTNFSNSNDYVQKIRLTFTSEGALSDGNNWFQVQQFKFLATDAWGFPSELAKNKHLYKTEVTSIVDSKDSSGNDIRVPYTSMNINGDIKANTIYEGNKKLSDKYVPYKDDGTSLVEGELKSYVGYGYQSNTGAYSGLFISGAHAAGNYGGQLSGSFDGGRLSFRGYNNGSFTDWKELAFNSQIDTLNTNLTNTNTKVSSLESQITNLSNSTQKAVYDYLSSPDNISDTTTSPTLLAKSNGTHEGTLSFYDTKFYNSQSASSNRAQVAYGYDNDYIGYRRYYNGYWRDWKKIAFEHHTPVSVTLIMSRNGNIIANVYGYDGPSTDVVTVNGNNVEFHNKIDELGNAECLVDFIYDMGCFANIILPDPSEDINAPVPGNIGKKITFYKEFDDYNTTDTTIIKSKTKYMCKINTYVNEDLGMFTWSRVNEISFANVSIEVVNMCKLTFTSTGNGHWMVE